MEPIIYKCIVLKYESGESARVLAGFLSALQTKPASFFATHVKTLLLCDIQTCCIMKILAICTGVTDLRIWPNTPSPVAHFVVTSSIRPTHLSFSAEHLTRTSRTPDFSLPFYQELTHLELNDTWGHLISWAPSFAMLSQLTHLALVFGFPFCCSSIATCGLGTVLANCSKLKVCVIRYMINEEELRFWQDSYPDPHVVLVPWRRSKARWADGLWNEKAELWTQAEAIIAAMMGGDKNQHFSFQLY